MLKKLFGTTRSRTMSWLQQQTASILPGHRKVYSIAMLLLLAMATLWNIYTVIIKNLHL